MSTTDWLNLFMYYLSTSLLMVGGVMVTAPDMHRFLVQQNGWLSDAQFTASIAMAQAAPGPNVLFVALFGWHVGLNTGSMFNALFGAVLTMVGLFLPNAILAYVGGSWAHRHRHLRLVRAFKAGMGPVVISLIIATGWIMAGTHNDIARDWKLWLVMLVAVLLVWRTRVPLIGMLLTGALLGGLGWI